MAETLPLSYVKAHLSEIADRVEGEDWGAALRRRTRRMLELLGSDPLLARFLLSGPTGAGDRIVERHHAAMEELVGLLSAGAPAPDGVAAPPERALAGGISVLLARRLGAAEGGELSDLPAALIELVARPYLGREEALRLAAAEDE